MSIWHAAIVRILRDSGLFLDVQLAGGKIRAVISPIVFLDIHFDPATSSYSYAVIDLTLPYAGDKRLYGWDDFPHPGYPDLVKMTSYPHHFQERQADGSWKFHESGFRGKIEDEIRDVLQVIRQRQF